MLLRTERRVNDSGVTAAQSRASIGQNRASR
jgi:hypothetical protein